MHTAVLGLLVLVGCVACQRPFYAPRPVGYGYYNQENTDAPAVVDRFGEGQTTEPLPVDARGDIDLINTISQWPREKQPFWYINYKIIEANRNRRTP